MRASELWPRWEVSHPMPSSSAEGSPFTGEGLLWGQACQCHASQPVLTPVQVVPAETEPQQFHPDGHQPLAATVSWADVLVHGEGAEGQI